MTESTLKIRTVGSYVYSPIAQPKDCTRCHNADWADVLIEGICGKCRIAIEDDLQKRIEELERFIKRTIALCENPNQRTEKSLSETCAFLDVVHYEAEMILNDPLPSLQ